MAGRPRKANVIRDARGKSRGERPVVHPETVIRRQRELKADGIDEKFALDQLAGFTLGRLLLRGDITQKQHNAGEEWARLVRRHASIMGYSLTIRSPGFEMVGGMSLAAEPDADEVDRVKGRWRDCYNMLCHADKDDRNGTMAITKTTYAVCVDNLPVGKLDEVSMGKLRTGLDKLAVVLR